MAAEFSPTFKRKYPRKSFRKVVSIMAGGKAALARGVEIGEGGLSFSTQTKLPVHSKVIVNLFLTEKDFFSVRVTLLNISSHSRGHSYGASFDDVSIALKRQIRAYVARTML